MANEATVKEWLDNLAATNTSTDEDSTKMQNLLHKVGFPHAVVVLGIVYLEGKGTIDAPPCSLHSMADMLVKTA